MTPLQITLRGHLTETVLEEAFAEITGELAETPTPRGVLVDCRQMVSYDMAARGAFVAFNQRWRGKISRVAIVTDNYLWHMVISVMGQASQQEMKPFLSMRRAEEWVVDGWEG